VALGCTVAPQRCTVAPIGVPWPLYEDHVLEPTISIYYSAQTVRPPPKPTYKWHILGMSASPWNDSHRP